MARDDKMKITTTKQVEKARAGTHSLGDGLMLIAGKSKRSWVLRVQHAGKRRDVGLGSFPAVGLADARRKAADLRDRAKQGVDIIAEKRESARALPTFAEIAALVIADAKAKSVNEKVKYQWGRHLGEPYCAPLLARPVNDITTLDVMNVLSPIWREKPEVARKVFPAIRRVFDRARIELRDRHGIELARNPADWTDLKAAGLAKPVELTRGHHPALDYEEMPAFIAALREREAIAARALEFLVLTCVRTDAIVKATWDQFDLDAAIWMIPLPSLKDREHRTEPFRVPLSPRAVAIVTQMRKLGSPLVFPGQNLTRPLSNMAMLSLLSRMNHGAVPRWIDPTDKRPITAHGFRATFKTWAEETATFPRAFVEVALGHKVGGKVEQAYMRGDLLKKRRKLMDAWAAYIEPVAADEKVTPMRRKA
jgi:integrase